MKKGMIESRRNFLKVSMAGAAGLAVAGPLIKTAKAATITVKLINISQTPINQNVDNLRVAYITDAAMVRSGTWQGFANFNNPNVTTNGVVYNVVETNMDKLACALANTTHVNQAWATLLKIPSTKTWSTAKAAIKINGIGDATNNLHASVPILVKLINVLVGLGMPEANITIFDMSQNVSAIYNTFKGAGKPIPAAVGLGSGGGDNTASFPAGYSMGASHWVSDSDIVINVGNNKGHDQYGVYSGVTMCLKNNKGCVDFGHNGMGQLTAANSCDYLLGNIPTTYPAKQQLCIVDSLWLGNPGDWAGGASTGKNANSILMGTFAGAVDYVGTMKIRAPIFPSGAANPAWNQTIVNQFMTNFGYGNADITTVMTPVTGAGKGLVDASPIVPDYSDNVIQKNPDIARQGNIQVSVHGNGFKPQKVDIYLAKDETLQSAEVFNVQGRKIRTLALNSGNHIVWDGRTDGGSAVNSGHYIVRLRGQRSETARDLLVSR